MDTYATEFKDCFLKDCLPDADLYYYMREPTEDDWLKFEKRLGISSKSSQQQLSSSSSSSSGKPEFEFFDKLYVLTHTQSFSDESSRCGIYGHSVYRIDSVNSASASKPLEPIFVWEDDYVNHKYNYNACLILGSKLYMFGGNSMSTYDMEGALSSSTMLPPPVPGPNMLGRKIQPIAVAIGHSKICVFSSILHHNHSSPCFELFDIYKGTWEELPEPIDCESYDPRYIESFCVHRSCLIIQTKSGIYGINVDNTFPEWVILDKSENFSHFPFHGMWSIVDHNLCGPFSVMKWGDPALYPFASSKRKPDRESLIKRHPMGILCRGGGVDDDRRIDLCIVRTGFPLDNSIPSLLIDIIKFDDEARIKFGSDLSKWKEFESHKSITLSLTTSRPCFHLEAVACFPIKDALESRAHSNKRFTSSKEREAEVERQRQAAKERRRQARLLKRSLGAEKSTSPEDESDPKRRKTVQAPSQAPLQPKANNIAPHNSSNAQCPQAMLDMGDYLAEKYLDALPSDEQISQELSGALRKLPKVNGRTRGVAAKQANAMKRESLALFYRAMILEEEAAAANAKTLLKAQRLEQENDLLKAYNSNLATELDQARAEAKNDKEELVRLREELAQSKQHQAELKLSWWTER